MIRSDVCNTLSTDPNQDSLLPIYTMPLPGPIMHLPDEVLVYCFTYLDPHDLTKLQLVCRKWFRLVNDEQSWKAAFLKHFGSQIPTQRLAAQSWRLEYIRRLALLRRWSSHRQRKITFEPKIGPLDTAFIELADQRMLVGSLAQGLVLRCDPLTGTVNRRTPYYAHPDDFPSSVSTMAFRPGAVAFGFLDGAVGITGIQKKDRQVTRRLLPLAHEEPVTHLVWPGVRTDVLMSAAVAESCAKLWDVRARACRRVLPVPSDQIITFIATQPNRAALVATHTGQLYVWSLKSTPLIVNQAAATLPTLPKVDPLTMDRNRNPPDQIINTGPAGIVQVFVDWGSEMALVWVSQAPWLKVYSLATGHLLANLQDSGRSTTDPLALPPVTCVSCQPVAWPANSAPSPSGLVFATGHLDGTVRTWSTQSLWPFPRRASSDFPPRLHPLRQLTTGGYPVTHVYMDAYKIITTGFDGTIVAWDCLTTDYLKTYSARIPGHQRRRQQLHRGVADPRLRQPPLANTADDNGPDPTVLDGHRRAMSSILVTIWDCHAPGRLWSTHQRYQLESPTLPVVPWEVDALLYQAPIVSLLDVQPDFLAAVVDTCVQTWNLSPQTLYSQRHRPKGRPATVTRGAPRTEMEQLVQDELADYHQERQVEQEQHQVIQRLRAQHSINGMSDDELMKYAMFLSMEQLDTATAPTTDSTRPSESDASETDLTWVPVTTDTNTNHRLQSLSTAPESSNAAANRPPPPSASDESAYDANQYAVDGLSEQEMLEYVLMLSRQDQ
ncbi:hypothetical protein H4R34_000730 [Dimargaris verticillata]|uniref:F-box domain-containing protein n=1 Tax=Dimargaris verticillata TaxID=2761393 RepID=A0A9W8B9T5_9FUNG|nr:hypothetical protein H4R34_000730 [Dimargaris verticillata]